MIGAGWQPGRQPYPPLPQMQVWWWGPAARQAGQPQPAAPPAAVEPVRIGDAERDAALSALGDHFSAGRLTREELDERADRALRARFETDLRPLFADLPAAGAPAAPDGRRRAGPTQGWGPPPLLWLLPLLVVGAVVGAIVWHAPFLIWMLVWVVVITKVTAARRRSRRPRDAGGTVSQPAPWSAGRR